MARMRGRMPGRHATATSWPGSPKYALNQVLARRNSPRDGTRCVSRYGLVLLFLFEPDRVPRPQLDRLLDGDGHVRVGRDVLPADREGRVERVLGAVELHLEECQIKDQARQRLAEP